jgi:hypothetical protein
MPTARSKAGQLHRHERVTDPTLIVVRRR